MLKYFTDIGQKVINKGLNTNKNFFSLEQGQTPSAINVNFNIDNSFGKRLGTTTMNAVALESTGGWGMYDCGISYLGIDTAVKLLLHFDGTRYQSTVADEMGKTIVHSNSGTVLYCSFDGSDGDTTYTSEVGSKQATFYGNAQLDTAEKKFGDSSLKLDGVGDYITFPASNDWSLGLSNSGNFTMECFIKLNATNYETVASTMPNASSGWAWHIQNNITFYYNSAQQTWTWAPGTATWYHIALVRMGTNLIQYINGSSLGVKSDGNFSTTGLLSLGNYYVSYDYPLDGWIDDFRITRGIALYKSDFTAPTVAYKNYELTLPKFGGASGYFDGASKFARVQSSGDFDFAANDFTIDFWTKLLQVGTSDFQTWCGMMSNSASYWYMAYTNNGINFSWVDTGVAKVTVAASALVWDTATWYHLELVRYGTAWTLYRGGSSLKTTNTSTTLLNTATNLYIGCYGSGTSGYLNGQIDEFRISAGIARHTSNFTVSTEAYGSQNIQHRRLICSSGSGTYYSADLGKTWTMCQSSRSATRNSFSFVKNSIINTNDLYDRPTYWTGTAGTYFKEMTGVPLCKYSLSHQGYFIMLNEASKKRGMYYVPEAEMYSSTSFSNFEFPTERNDEICGGFVLNNFLYCYSKYKMYRVLYIGGNPDWSYTEIKAWGYVPHTVKKVQIPNVGQVIIGLDWNKRIRIFDGTDDETLSESIREDNGVTPFYMDNINDIGLAKSWAENDVKAQMYRLFVAYGTSETLVTHCVNYNYQAKALFVDDNRIFHSGVLALDTADCPHMLACTYDGYIHHIDSGNTDAGTAIQDSYISPLYYKQNPAVVSKAQQLGLYFGVKSSGTIYIEDATQYSTTFELRKTFTLGNAISSIQIEQLIDLPLSFNSYQFKISSSSNTAEPWQCNYINLQQADLGLGKP